MPFGLGFFLTGSLVESDAAEEGAGAAKDEEEEEEARGGDAAFLEAFPPKKLEAPFGLLVVLEVLLAVLEPPPLGDRTTGDPCFRFKNDLLLFLVIETLLSLGIKRSKVLLREMKLASTALHL